MEEIERKKLQELVNAVHETTRALMRSAAATGSWPAVAAPGSGPASLPGVGPTRTGSNAEAIMYGYGAAQGPGIGGYGFWTVAPNPYTYGYGFGNGFGNIPGNIGPMGLTHNGPGTPVGYPIAGVPGLPGVPGVGIPLWGFNPAASVGFANPALAAATLGPAWGYRPFGLSHLGPEGFGIGAGSQFPGSPGYGSGWPTSYPGLPLTPAWTSSQPFTGAQGFTGQGFNAGQGWTGGPSWTGGQG